MHDALDESKVRNKEGRHAPTTLPESAWQPVPTCTILVALFLLACERSVVIYTLQPTLCRLSYDYSRTVATSCRNASECTKSAQELPLLCFPARATVPFRHAWRPQVALSEAPREYVVVRNKDGAELRSSQR